jgi:UDP-N-acetylglucosamine 1-carboxyvinyltransferase
MATLRIQGGRRLSGRIAVEGNKNSALPLLAACLLTDQECVLTNVPRIRDVEVLLDLLVGLGATVDGVGTSTLRVRCTRVTSDTPDPTLVGRLRGSVLLLGPLLARIGSARLAPPGGDFPARRTISTHLQALAAMGAVPLNSNSEEAGHRLEAPNGLKGASLYLDEASVTGTEASSR